MPTGQWSKAALKERYAAQADEEALLSHARDYAVGHNVGARKTLNTCLFPGVTRNKLHNLLSGEGRLAKKEQSVRSSWAILTLPEETTLAQWIISSGRGKDPATDEDISEQIIRMLKARRVDNRRRNHGRGTVAAD